MGCIIDISLQLGDAFAGKTLQAQLQNETGLVDSPITTGFIEIAGGNGQYLWHYEDMPCTFNGAILFMEVSNPAEVVTMTSINASELENKNTRGVTLNVGHSEDTTIGVNRLANRNSGLIQIRTGVDGVEVIGVTKIPSSNKNASQIRFVTGVTKA